MTQEPWFKIDWINWLKLRGEWGISGNQTSRYKSLSRVDSNAAYVFGDGGTTEMGQMISTMSNPDLKWEKTTGINIGLDFAALNNRITGTLEF